MSYLKNSADWEALYHQIGQIIAEEPWIPLGPERASGEILRWLGRAEVLVGEVSGIVDQSKFKSISSAMLTASRSDAEPQMRHLRSLLYVALAKAEINAPTAAKGAFIPAGNSFDALTAVSGVLRECRGSALVVDPYLDPIALTEFLHMLGVGIPLRLFASGKQKSSGLPEAVKRWRSQYQDSRPIEIRFAPPRLLHDRLIMDDANVWSLSQSFNSIAQRSPAMIQRVSPDIALIKRQAFLEMWQNSEPEE